MKQRLSLAFSAAALVVAVLGVTPLGQAAGSAARGSFAAINRVNSANVIVATSTNQDVGVNCPAGTSVVGGGGEVGKVPNSPDIEGVAWLSWSRPNGAGGWTVHVHNGGANWQVTATAYAICVP